MNEASRIVHELQSKLAELDRRVWLYRREMASEFEKYAENLLQNVTSDVNETVIRTMTQSIKDYRSIYPDGGTIFGSHAPEDCSSHKKAMATLSDSLRGSAIDPCKEPDSQNSKTREMELHGIFVPNYLPLLDHSSFNRQSTSPGLPIKHYDDKGSGCAKDYMQVDACTEVTELPPSSLSINTSTSQRRYTEEVSYASNSSVSDCGTIRRSALRALSTSSKPESQSPRRVRFDMAGEEVLPTSSPISEAQSFMDSTSMITLDSDGDNSDSGENQGFNELNSPKKISSSQAVRLLSRRSLDDDGTIWTPVCSPPGEPASNISSNNTTGLPSEHHGKTHDVEPSSSVGLSLNQITLRQPISIKNVPTNEKLLYQLPQPVNKRVSPSKPKPCSRDLFSDLHKTQKLQSNESQGDEKEESFQEDMFKFDEPSLLEQKRMNFHLEEESEEEDEEDFLTIRANRSKSFPVYTSPHSKSSALPIPQASSRATSETSGSLDLEISLNKDHPFSIPIVRQEVHARAASLGSAISFVGSVDGRTGLDESNVILPCSIGSPEMTVLESLRAGRAPQSFTERMLLEDLVEEDLSRLNVSHHAVTRHSGPSMKKTLFEWPNKSSQGNATKV